jgi:hypothetical protein
MAKKHRRRRGGPSRIEDHHRQGRRLVPPLMNMPAPVVLTSWRDDRMPELLWATLLLSEVGRDRALQLFRAVMDRAEARGTKAVLVEMEHGKRATVPTVDFDDVFEPILAEADAREALRPMLIFETLPDREHWLRHLESPAKDAGPRLAAAVAPHVDHQSQEATDCRWLRLRHMEAVGLIELPPNLVEELRGYPDLGDQRSVRPFIRAAEGTMGSATGDPKTPWSHDFWRECWERTDCLPARRRVPAEVDHDKTFEQLALLYREVAEHFIKTRSQMGLDARHDAVFGLVLYTMNLAALLHQGGADQRVEGRLAIRTLTEAYVTLAYLVAVDQPTVWAKFRSYGSGQAKLAFLKLYDLDHEDLPAYVTREELERLANEDMWQEFAEVELGSWSGLDLRKMSEAAGIKDIYDKYYGWPSGYVHAQWGAVRDTVFDLCLNPLNRFHRIPASPRCEMESVAPDAAKLVNMMLDLLGKAYPEFKSRVHKGRTTTT